MAVIVQTFESALPVDLFERLARLRTRYAAALRAAAEGDYSRQADLRSASRYIGRLLAREARKSPAERGGLSMLEISLAVDGFIRELHGWNQYEIQRCHQERIRAGIALPTVPQAPRKAG